MKKQWNKEISDSFQEVLKMMLEAPEREMEPYVKEKIKNFLKKHHTSKEIYDFCDEISKLPMIKINNNVCMGDISSFVQVTLNVTKYYKK